MDEIATLQNRLGELRSMKAVLDVEVFALANEIGPVYNALSALNKGYTTASIGTDQPSAALANAAAKLNRIYDLIGSGERYNTLDGSTKVQNSDTIHLAPEISNMISKLNDLGDRVTNVAATLAAVGSNLAMQESKDMTIFRTKIHDMSVNLQAIGNVIYWYVELLNAAMAEYSEAVDNAVSKALQIS